MSAHLNRDLATLHRNLLQMGGLVEDVIHEAVGMLANPNSASAEQLIERDNDIDEFDVRIEDDCLKILALHQPVAVDLRRITTAMKIANELERVADIAIHIAERAHTLKWQTDLHVPNKLKRMAQLAIDMLHRSIDAYVELDSGAARRVIDADDMVDEANKEIIQRLVDTMQDDSQQVEAALQLFSISRHIERVADHATNIAEDIVFLVDGVIIRHGGAHQHSPSEIEAAT